MTPTVLAIEQTGAEPMPLVNRVLVGTSTMLLVLAPSAYAGNGTDLVIDVPWVRILLGAILVVNAALGLLIAFRDKSSDAWRKNYESVNNRCKVLEEDLSRTKDSLGFERNKRAAMEHTVEELRKRTDLEPLLQTLTSFVEQWEAHDKRSDVTPILQAIRDHNKSTSEAVQVLTQLKPHIPALIERLAAGKVEI